VDFCGGQISRDAGLLTLRAFDERYHLTADLAEPVHDARDPERVDHSLRAMLRQRLYALCAGYEDANDAPQLRHDPILKMVADKPLGQELASQPTLSRRENAVTGRDIARLTRAGREGFMRVGGEAVRRRGEILLDVDSTDDPTQGAQQLSLFNGHYGQPVYHPLIVLERPSGCLLDVRLRRGNGIGYNRVLGRWRCLLRRLRSAFPEVPIRLRAAAGFGWRPLFDLLEEERVEYAIRIQRSQPLRLRAEPAVDAAARAYADSQKPQRHYTSFTYRARKWKLERRVLAQAQHNSQEKTVYFLVTNRSGEAETVWQFYNGRGEGENRIAEFKNGFHADRLSCHRFLAKAFRLGLHRLAYNLVNSFRQQLPEPLRTLQIGSLRTRLFKVSPRPANCPLGLGASGQRLALPGQLSIRRPGGRLVAPPESLANPPRRKKPPPENPIPREARSNYARNQARGHRPRQFQPLYGCSQLPTSSPLTLAPSPTRSCPPPPRPFTLS
jgi:hypothetical protein